MTVRLLLTIVLSLPFTLAAAFGQESLKANAEDPQLSNPSGVKVELLRRQLELNEEPNNLMAPFTTGDRIFFRIQMTNTTAHPITFLLTNPYFQNRPELTKDGESVEYRKKIVEDLEYVDRQVDFPHSSKVTLEPFGAAVVGQITLSDWYSNLGGGNYELKSRFRFVVNGEWTETNVVAFEVKSK